MSNTNTNQSSPLSFFSRWTSSATTSAINARSQSVPPKKRNRHVVAPPLPFDPSQVNQGQARASFDASLFDAQARPRLSLDGQWPRGAAPPLPRTPRSPIAQPRPQSQLEDSSSPRASLEQLVRSDYTFVV
ncbi:hypothetical protein BCR33DRAFT_714710 [Rhizoclosmatium globosum]|uniref:Uncharacterized protein n=1 Tax=Rhizoclosmatium globosum TaxID=329046 RepID=A0A1Y2CKQ0_9FUNG|nr:hypothetical protein BCR33DRAFT_714710 [Rhizoclosmatium globosum]|eukprot:ORY47598.1 hypothetical protein BCR33DRAFT_714710 [Rhizoclosmatium globosum]